MALDDMDGIANVAFTVGGTLTWSSAADWDAAVDEFGVVHENTNLTAYDDAGLLQKGYATATNGNPPFQADIVDLWLFHPSSGDTIGSHVSGGNDGTLSGGGIASRTATGICGNPAWRFDSANGAYIDTSTSPNIGGNDDASMMMWYYSNGEDGARGRQWNISQSESDPIISIESDQSIRTRFYDDQGDGDQHLGSNFSTGSWQMVSSSDTPSSSSLKSYLNGSDVTSLDGTGSRGAVGGNDPETLAGAPGSGGDYVNGRMAVCMLWNRTLSASEHQDLYDVVMGESHLETATKTLGALSKPDLVGLDYSLNGESITVDVIGSPGEAGEEVVSQVLDGSTSYSLTWSNSHTDFRVKLRLSSSTPTVTPTVNSISVEA